MFAEKYTRTGLLGMNVQGDMGPLTMYVSTKKKIVAFRKSPPRMPANCRQAIIRNKVRTAAIRWNNLTKNERRAYGLAARRSGCQCSGYNLWVSAIVRNETEFLKTIAHQTGIVLTLP